MNRRDQLLQQMGIRQWQLKYPERLKGLVNIPLETNIRLVIVSEQEISWQDPVLQDVLRSLDLSAEQSIRLNFEQISHLQVEQPVHYWWLSENATKIHRTLSQLPSALSHWQSPNWLNFKRDPQAKKALWKQIQQPVTTT